VTKIKISMTIDKDILNDFKGYCKENGMKLSPKVEVMMKNCLKDISLNKFI